MPEEHPNVALVQRLDLADLDGSRDVFADDVVFHYFNPRLPDLQGDYVGVSGIATFFERVGAATEGSFEVEPISIDAVGDELVVTQTRNRMLFQGAPIEIDVVEVWRIVSGRISEVWDIPSVYSTASAAPAQAP